VELLKLRFTGSKKQGIFSLKWNKKYSDLFWDILVKLDTYPLKNPHFMGKESCTQNIKKTKKQQEKGILKIAKNKSRNN